MMRSWKLWAAVGVGLLILLAGGEAVYSYGGASLSPGVDNDPKKLLPGFAKKLEVLFQRMRARGFQPVLFEGYRTAERAKALAAKGTGIAASLHILGAAADIVDRSTYPDYWKGAPGFWTALRDEAEAIGLVSGARFSKPDIDHVQAIAVKDEVAFRAMTPDERAQTVA